MNSPILFKSSVGKVNTVLISSRKVERPKDNECTGCLIQFGPVVSSIESIGTKKSLRILYYEETCKHL